MKFFPVSRDWRPAYSDQRHLGDLKLHDIDNISSTIFLQHFPYELTRSRYQTLFAIVIHKPHCQGNEHVKR
jgi:hypothetical protein